jgi:glyoxylase-like metal-dependent hydrolase (beta-lactamase superfamily II)/ferredoxin
MADPRKALSTNIAGNFFVDSTCIDCDTCRQLAPDTFVEDGEYSSVFRQPESAEQAEKAIRALLCCPTASIGTRDHTEVNEVVTQFPLPLADDVFYCGFNSEKSYGGNSFFVKRPGGNWLIDSPRYVSHLVKRFEELGGIKYIFLTHRDDVADAKRFAEKFGAQRIIHRRDLSAAPDCEIVIEGTAVTELAPSFKIIPTPGHTAGHCVLLLKDKFLFTGDHLAFDRESKRLMAFRRHCWYSWPTQIESMENLLNYSFEWVLAGHGDRVMMSEKEMQQQLSDLIASMRLP